MSIYSKSQPVFYVYAFLRTDGSPYYIGKGHGRRAFKKRKFKPNDPSKISILAQHLTEGEAFNLERKLIAEFGRIDIGTGILRNLTDGGEGATGRVLTDDHKAKIGKAMTGRKPSALANTMRQKAKLGVPLTPAQKLAISLANKGRSKPISQCPRCGTRGGAPQLARWHFDNCKAETITRS